MSTAAQRRARPPDAGAGDEPLFDPFDVLMVRAPLLPLRREDGAGATFAGMIDDPAVRRAIAVASRTLAASAQRPARDARAQRRRDASLLRYFLRMTSRPTPFGLCAGAALGRFGAHTDLRLADAPPVVRSRPDMVVLHQAIDALEAQPAIRSGLAVVAHPAVTVRRGRATLGGIEAQHTAAGAARISMRATPALRRVLELARQPIGWAELAAALCAATPGATLEKADGLLEELRRCGFLITDLRPPLTAADPFGHVVARLRAIASATDVAGRLAALQARLAAWDAAPAAAAAADFAALAAEVETALGVPFRTPLQVDMRWPLAGDGVNIAVGHEAARAAELLLRLTPFPSGLTPILAYREAFTARYGSDRDVPLLEMLDPDQGIGPPPDPNDLVPLRSPARDRMLIDIAARALHDRARVVELTGTMIATLQTWSPRRADAPASLDLYVAVAAASAQAIDAGDFAVVVGPNVGAAAAGRNLGRFAELLGTEGGAALRRIARAEQRQRPDRVFAELIFPPERARTANVVTRPQTRDHQIGLRASAHPDGMRTIPLDELVVRVTAGRFALLWQAPGAPPRRVEVCAGHMLNHKRAPALCRFLADVGRDGMVQLNGFDWGVARDFPYLPRLQAGRVVLRLAQWRIDPLHGDLAAADDVAFGAALARWRAHWNVPRHVFLGSGDGPSDHRLLLDLDDGAQAAILREEIGRLAAGGHVLLQEAYPAPDQAWLQGPGGGYVGELVVSLLRRSGEVASETVAPVSAPVPMAQRLRPPGSDWLYLKLYCDPAVEDALIGEAIADFAGALQARRQISGWSFLRYSDPAPHLRLRLHGRSGGLRREVMAQACDWAAGLMRDDLVAQFAVDTYEREVERYGGIAGMAAAERLYAADSRAVAALLALARDEALPFDRLALAAVSVDDLLAGVGLDTEARRALYQRHADAAGPAAAREATEAYRVRKADLIALLRAPLLGGVRHAGPVRSILARRGRALAPIAATLADAAARGALGRDLPTLCASYAHLHCNRLLGRDRAREQHVLALLLRVRKSLDAGA